MIQQSHLSEEKETTRSERCMYLSQCSQQHYTQQAMLETTSVCIHG